MKIVDLAFEKVRRMVLPCVLLLVASSILNAADDLTVNVSIPNNGRIRSNAPLPIEINIEWRNERLLEGYVEIKFREVGANYANGLQTFYTYRTPDLALSFGKRTLTAQLPNTPLRNSDNKGLLTYDLKFVGVDTTIPFSTSTLIIPAHDQRLIIGHVLSDTMIPEANVRYVSRLSFEKVFPVSKLPNIKLRSRIPGGGFATTHPLKKLITQTHRIDAIEFPKSAHRLCAYDMLIVADGSLPKLNEKQLNAIRAWIEAGGTALIEKTDSGQSRAHLDFFNKLADSSSTIGLPFVKTEDGRIEMSFEDASLPAWKNARGFQAGLGRVVVANQRLERILAPNNKPVGQQIGEFLWNKRLKPVKNGTDNLTHSALNSALVPSSVQSVPASSVIGMLVLFLLAISVGDYFLLGLIDKRTWTWVLFPVISIGFTCYTVYMARHYVGSSDFTTAITMIDTAADGRVLRSSRIEMLFTAAERMSTTKVRNAMFAPLTEHVVSPTATEILEGAMYQSRGQQVNLRIPPACVGSVPSVYEVQRNMRKWTPQIDRYTTIGRSKEADLPEFTWGVDDWNRLNEQPVFDEWAKSILSQFPNAQVTVIQPGQRFSTLGNKITSGFSDQRSTAVWNVISGLTVSDNRHTQHLSARIAPTGGCFLDDIPTIDRTNTNEFAAIVVIPRGEEFLVYRHTHFGAYIFSATAEQPARNKSLRNRMRQQ